MGEVKYLEWTGCLLDDLRAFDINTIRGLLCVAVVAQDEREYRKTEEHMAGGFMAKSFAAKKVSRREVTTSRRLYAGGRSCSRDLWCAWKIQDSRSA